MPASPFIPDSPFINSCAQSTAVAWSLGKATKLLLYMLSLYLCIYYVLFVDIFTRSFDDFISMKFLIVVFLPASPFIPTSPFINFGDSCQPPRLFRPPLLFQTREYIPCSSWSQLANVKNEIIKVRNLAHTHPHPHPHTHTQAHAHTRTHTKQSITEILWKD